MGVPWSRLSTCLPASVAGHRISVSRSVSLCSYLCTSHLCFCEALFLIISLLLYLSLFWAYFSLVLRLLVPFSSYESLALSFHPHHHHFSQRLSAVIVIKCGLLAGVVREPHIW